MAPDLQTGKGRIGTGAYRRGGTHLCNGWRDAQRVTYCAVQCASIAVARLLKGIIFRQENCAKCSHFARVGRSFLPRTATYDQERTLANRCTQRAHLSHNCFSLIDGGSSVKVRRLLTWRARGSHQQSPLHCAAVLSREHASSLLLL